MPDQFGHSDADLERGDMEYMRAKEDGALPPSTPTMDAIRREIGTLSDDGTPALWIRVTHPVWNTIRVEHHRLTGAVTEDGHPISPSSLFGLPVSKYPTGSIDAPGWQLMTTPKPSR